MASQNGRRKQACKIGPRKLAVKLVQKLFSNQQLPTGLLTPFPGLAIEFGQNSEAKRQLKPQNTIFESFAQPPAFAFFFALRTRFFSSSAQQGLAGPTLFKQAPQKSNTTHWTPPPARLNRLHLHVFFFGFWFWFCFPSSQLFFQLDVLTLPGSFPWFLA